VSRLRAGAHDERALICREKAREKRRAGRR
jgi:hypothetical protein